MKELTQYYRQIKRWLPCNRSLKKRLMANIHATTEEYLAHNPAADFTAVQAHFGTPQQIAVALVDEMDTAELLRSLLIRRRIVNIILTCVIAILAIWLVAVLSVWCSGMLGVFGYGILEQPIIS